MGCVGVSPDEGSDANSTVGHGPRGSPPRLAQGGVVKEGGRNKEGGNTVDAGTGPTDASLPGSTPHPHPVSDSWG